MRKRAIRPIYVFLDDLAKNTVVREFLIEKDRAVAIEAVLMNAADMGMKKAIEQFGDSLLATEKKVLSTLTKEELKVYKTVKEKVGSLFNLNDIIINVCEE